MRDGEHRYDSAQLLSRVPVASPCVRRGLVRSGGAAWRECHGERRGRDRKGQRTRSHALRQGRPRRRVRNDASPGPQTAPHVSKSGNVETG